MGQAPLVNSHIPRDIESGAAYFLNRWADSRGAAVENRIARANKIPYSVGNVPYRDGAVNLEQEKGVT